MVIHPAGHPARVSAKRLLGDLVNQYNLLDRSDLSQARKLGYIGVAFEYLFDYVDSRTPDSGQSMDPDVENHIRTSCREVFEPLQRAGLLDAEDPANARKPWRMACDKNKKSNGYARPILWGLMDLGIDWESGADLIDTASLAAVEQHPRWAKTRLSDIAQTSRAPSPRCHTQCPGAGQGGHG